MATAERSVMSSDGRALDPDERVRIVLRPVGTPVALGLAAILIGTAMLSGLQMGWLTSQADQQTVGFVGIAAAFPLELLAAILAFLARDSLLGTGLGTFSSVWAVSGLTFLTGPVGVTNHALGMFLIVGALILGLLLISAGGGRVVFGAVIACGSVRLALSGLYELEASHGLKLAAGISGLVLAAACAYGIVSLLTEDLPRKQLLPVGRSGRAASAISGGLQEQLDQLENEAGVRRQL
jgi:succinate-acetate transporter protein